MSIIRLTGMASGLDTEQMIKDLSKVQNMRVDSVKKERQLVSWRQEMYRDVINKISGFAKSHFDIVNPSTNFRSPSSFAKFTYDTTLAGASTSKVSVSATGDLKDFDQAIQSVTQLATKDTWTGDVLNLRGIKSDGFNLDNLKTTLAGADFRVALAIDGVSKTIEISNADVQAMTSIDDLVSNINSQVVSQFGSDFANVITKVNINGNDELMFDKKGNDVRLMEYIGFGSSMQGLTIASGSSNQDYKNKKVSELFDLTGIDISALTINNVGNLGITADDTIADMISKVNSSGAGVKLDYNAASDKFILESLNEGSVNDITLQAGDTVHFFSKLGVTDGPNRVHGQNALLRLNGEDIVKSSNTFNMDGMIFTLKDTYDGSSGDIKIAVKKDTSAIVNNIKGFVEEYNKIIEHIQGKVNEKRDRDYLPLTDEQKKDMREEDIKKWDERAKLGILGNDSELMNLANKMRRALYENISGAGISMAEIGITTSSDFRQGGKLVIDEAKLTSAVENRYDEVVKLFTAQSDKAYLDTASQKERYEENGIANRLNDIFQDAVRTTRDSQDKKGYLIEKAGIENDSTQFNNILQKSLDSYDKRIDVLLEKLQKQEDYYYEMFARMETAMARLQNQSASLLQQLGGGQ